MSTQPRRGVFVGLTTVDIISRVHKYPSANEKVTASRQDISAGGPAANAAVTFAGLGGSATLLTCIGQGQFAELALRDLEEHGVQVVDCAPTDFSIAVSSITVTEESGDRAIVSTDGHGTQGNPSVGDRAQEVEKILESCEVVLFDGHHPTLAMEVLDLAESLNTPLSTVLDAGRWKPQFEQLTPRVNYVVASEDFTDPYGWIPETTTTDSTLEATVIRTRGKNPVEWWACTESGVVEVESVQVVDTLGAGDVFHGAFAYAIIPASEQGERLDRAEVEQAIRSASRVSAFKIQHIGTRSWLQHKKFKNLFPAGA